MELSVKQLFDRVAQDYDLQRKQLIPCFDDFYGMTLDLMESPLDSPRILDLGAGTGLLSGMVLQKYPNARLTLIDISDQMLEGARRRFDGVNQVQYVVGDYSKYNFTSSYDMIISSLSIHHLTHADKNTYLVLYISCWNLVDTSSTQTRFREEPLIRTPITASAGWRRFMGVVCQMKPSRLPLKDAKWISTPRWRINWFG